MDKHVLHKRSKDGAKIPEVGKIDYGEIAINYKKGNETFFIKNDEDEIVSLPIKSEDYVAKTGDTMTGDLIISKSNLSVGNLNKFFWYGGTGTFAFAQGRGCMAIGDYTHAEGDYTIASGSSSHAEGISTEANGEASHAEGYTTTARTIYAHAEGHSTTAGGEASHAEGSSTRALGKHSHAEGKNTDANGECSHVEGFGTLANNYTEHANGAFNKTIGRDETSGVAITADTQATLFSIGNGTGDNNRRNAFEVKWNGDAYFSGDTKFAKGITANTISASNVYNSTDIDNKLSSKLDVSVYNNDKGDFASKSDLALKADKSDTYTKTEVDGLIPDISKLATKTELTNGLSSKANTADVYSKIDMNAELTKKLDKSVYDTDKPTFATKNDLDTKEDKGVAYSKAESNTLLADKANVSDVYSKSTMDTKLGNKADLTYVDNGLNNKVDKETDKGLSSNDFTNTLKLKLDDLKNYDETAIKTEINGKVAKTGDTIIGVLTVEGNLSVGYTNSFTSGTTSGTYAFAQGESCTAIGNQSHAEGYDTTASGHNSHAEGSKTRANGTASHAEGQYTQANGHYSHAEGYSTVAIGNYSHAEGSGSTAIGNYSHAEGWMTEANGEVSHAEGFGAVANGHYSHAKGHSTVAIGNQSHAEGFGTTASGHASHAEGWMTEANGEASHAEGSHTVANNSAEHANGAYNVSISGTSQYLTALTADTQATLFSVGNGVDDQNRRNAFEIKWNGDAYFSGDTKFDKGVSAETISATTITSPSLDNKQEILISGTNIKTINNISLLGSGNIDIQGGGGGGTVYTIGDGISLVDTEVATNILSLQIDSVSSEPFVYLGEKGLAITGVTAAITAERLVAIDTSVSYAIGLIATAKQETLDAASLDASTKANASKDASIKHSDKALSDAITLVKSDVLSTASTDASTKANNAKKEAIEASATDTTNKIGICTTDLTKLVTDETNRATLIEGGLRTDVNSKVSNVKLVKTLGTDLEFTLMVDDVAQGKVNIPANQFLKTAAYDDNSKELVLLFGTDGGDTETRILVSDLVDTYTASNGLEVNHNDFSIKIDGSSENYISVGIDGLKLGGIDAMVNGVKSALESSITDIDTKINNEITRATTAESVNTKSIADLKTELMSHIDSKFGEVTTLLTSLTNRITALEAKKCVVSNSIETILPISSTDFEALTTKDSSTLYTIIG